MLLTAMTFPWLCLGFVLWMARFEDGLPAAVRRAERIPDPKPITAIPIQRLPTVQVPNQRSEGARWAKASVGGSTNR